MKHPSLDIVIVNWNSGGALRACLESIAAADCSGFTLRRIVVVDNASVDGSADDLDADGLPLQLLRNPVNRGFGAACNQGAAGSDADYVLFLNPDTRLEADSLCKPVAFLEDPANARIGILGIQLLTDEGRVSRDCALFPTPLRLLLMALRLNKLFMRGFPYLELRSWDHSESREVERVKGAFYLTRRALFNSLEGFDERFFLYWEDVDFSLRAARAGWRSFYLAGVRAYHQRWGCSRRAPEACLYHELRSRIRYAYKHFGWPSATLVTLAVFCCQPISHLLTRGIRASPRRFREVLAGYRLLWRQAPEVLRDALEAAGRPLDAGPQRGTRWDDRSVSSP
jgi:GT2 family glycosyltransferase